MDINIRTDSVAMLKAIELYNQDNPDINITILPTHSQETVDIYIGNNLNNPGHLELLDEYPKDWLTDMNIDKFIESAQTVILDNENKIIPLAFDVPLVLIDKSQAPNVFPLSIDMGTLTDQAIQYNVISTSTSARRGYNPLWQPKFLDTLLLSYDTNIQLGSDFISWDSSVMKEAITKLTTFIDYDNGFRKKYFIEHPYNLLTSGRIKFWLVTFEEWLEMPENIRSETNFYFFNTDSKLESLPQYLSIGLTPEGLKKKTPLEMVNWLLDSNNQKRIIDSRLESKDLIKGAYGGLSTIKASNEYLSSLYKQLAHRFPRSEDFELYHHIPEHWDDFVETGLIPWFENPRIEKNEENFSQMVENWHRSSLQE